MDLQTLSKANLWASSSALTHLEKAEITSLIQASKQDPKAAAELSDRFYKDLEFGTGGLRGVLGLGTNRLNLYNVRKTAKALVDILQKLYPQQSLRITIGFDTRLGSQEFAAEFAQVCSAYQITTFLSPQVIPVPMLSYSIRELKCDAGVMITASHNPKIYNGIKVYWQDGCQIIPPYDQMVIDAYNHIESFEGIPALPMDQARSKGLIKDLPAEILEKYYQELLKRSFNHELCTQRGHEIKIVYTPLHGAGAGPCKKALDQLGLTNVLLVKEQMVADGQFSTLSVPPNPENPAALEMAVNLLKAEKAHLVFATDPDSDRLGVVVAHSDGVLHYLNGNQLAVLLLHYILYHKQQKGELNSRSLVIKTIVTTPLMDWICRSFNVHLENTLTGFKWMCGLMGKWERDHRPFEFVFASEESFGYLPHDLCRDKDGVGALSFVAEMALWYQVQGKTLVNALDDIYEKYGLCYESLVSLDYYGQAGAQKIQRIMDYFRADTCDTLAGENIVAKEDYEQNPTEIVPASNVIGLQLESGSKIYLRPSGTEPKIKFYLMVKQDQGTLADKKSKAKEVLQKYETIIRKIAEEV